MKDEHCNEARIVHGIVSVEIWSHENLARDVFVGSRVEVAEAASLSELGRSVHLRVCERCCGAVAVTVEEQVVASGLALCEGVIGWGAIVADDEANIHR